MNSHNHSYVSTTPMSYTNGEGIQFVLAFLFVLAFVMYIVAAIQSSRHYKTWPLYRIILWSLGMVLAFAAVFGPLAARAHNDFTAHMIVHLLLGMLAPLLLVLGAPMTLLLRTLNVSLARRLSRILKSRPVWVLMNPIVTSLLNIGGLWILYTTDLYMMMHNNLFFHIVIHLHIFLAGYIFTASMIYVDPTPHSFSFVYRTLVLVLALAGHNILSKYMYAQPPNGVPIAQAEMGSMLMYYGGGMVDFILIWIFISQWFKATRPQAVIFNENAAE